MARTRARRSQAERPLGLFGEFARTDGMAETRTADLRQREVADGGKRRALRGVPTNPGAVGLCRSARGRVYGYLNRCAHIGVELDWLARGVLRRFRAILDMHDAWRDLSAESGDCIAGPCRGARLEPLDIVEQDGGIYLK
jgi:nitrite reductase/ring-hydroxylating ferredoxin subunit